MQTACETPVRGTNLLGGIGVSLGGEFDLSRGTCQKRVYIGSGVGDQLGLRFRTFGELEDALLAARRDGTVELTRSVRADVDLVFGFDELVTFRENDRHAKAERHAFLIVGLETPVRASSGCATMHS